MLASAKNLKPENTSFNGEWTSVPTGLGSINFPTLEPLPQQGIPWPSRHNVVDPERQLNLMQEMQICINKLKHSQFYHTFLDQIQNTQIVDNFVRALDSELKMQMVIYGIGSIESDEPCRFQLSLAILMKRKFSWIGEIEVFDPVLSTTETRVLEALGCSVLSVNEQARRKALKPTFFFMPHCDIRLYNNLLQENWQAELLNHTVVFGNSFKLHEQIASKYTRSYSAEAKHVLGVQKFMNEFRIKTFSDEWFGGAFGDSSLHFFYLDPEIELQCIQAYFFSV
ncbi:hypothetical protein HHK36_019612 [Tetracentron sinense]|uniref:SRR1-like domain-containing protein n=1 Tax=Tetracentron sinense TaxID=13715 RepID=A0A834Z2H7_TETSI|nr:hypothetical protein HHK36_019612 [Tetracentron sinense]